MNEETQAPQGAAFTLTVPLDRAGKTATYYLKEMEEDIYLAAKSLMENKKEPEAVRLMVKALCLPGSDSPDLLKNNFIAVNSAASVVLKLVEPLEAELKKN